MSGTGTLDEDAVRILGEKIADFDQLQLLLRLHEAGGAAVPVDHDTREAALAALHALREATLAEPVDPGETAWRYAAEGETALAIDRIAAAFRANPAEIIRLLSARAIERVRTAALRTFADAFIIGRKKDG